MILLDLIHNLALLVAMAAAYRIVSNRWGEDSLGRRLTTGVLFGAVALVGMMTPVRLLPGVIFDGRSIILGVAGFVGGPLVALVAGSIAAAYRIWLGGVGTAMGVAVVAESAVLGVGFHFWRRRSGRAPGIGELALFGLAIHVVMAALLLTLPGEVRRTAWAELGAAILLVYPLVTVIVCRVFLDYERLERAHGTERAARGALRESRERMELALRGGELGTWDWDVLSGVVIYNERCAEMLGYTLDEIKPDIGNWTSLVHPDDLPRVMEVLDIHLQGLTDQYESEHRARHKSGRWVWVLDRGSVIERDGEGRPLRAAGTHLDITSRKEAVDALRAREERLVRQNQALLALMSGGELFGAELRKAVGRITEAGTGLAEVGRVGLWWYSDDYASLECWDLFEVSTGLHTEGARIRCDTLPANVAAHRAGEVIAAADVRTDPRTRDFPVEYWSEHDIHSLLDAPVWIGNRVAGVLCFEHVGAPRAWVPEDERLAATLANLVSLCIESTGRAQAEDEARGRVAAVERMEAELRQSLEEAERARGALLGTLDDRRKAEEALRESEAFIRAVMEHLPIGVAVNSVDPTVDFLFMNDNFPRFYRTTREALADPDQFWEAAYEDPSFRARMKERVLGDVLSGDPERMHWQDVPITRAGEQTTFVSAQNTAVPGRPLMISTVWDVTDRKRAETDLRESEARFRRLAENAPDVIFRYRLLPEEERGFEYVSPAAKELTGYTPEAHYADPDLRWKMVHPDDREGLTIPAATGPAAPVVLRWIRKDGGVVWVELRSVAVQDSEGNMVAVEGIARDVTERMRHEREVRTLADGLELKVQERTHQLQAANAELESFSYSVSHDLKAPLRAIDGYSALLQDTAAAALDDDGRRLVEEIRTNARQMGRLIEDLLTFSRVGRATLVQEVVTLGPMIEEIADRERRLAPHRRIELVMGDLPGVRGDPVLLRQALDNIVGNAVKFTRPREVARIEVTAQREDGAVEIAVRDNGVGFDPQYQRKLFRVFERLHYQEEFEGTGVGLAIVKRIMDRHRGRVTAESELGAGTVIRLTLPGA